MGFPAFSTFEPEQLLPDTLRHSGWTLSYSPPPYDIEKPLSGVRCRPEGYSLLLLDGPAGDAEGVDLQRGIWRLRGAFAMPCFVRFDCVDTATKQGHRATVIAAGGEILPATEPIRKRALCVLTQRRDLASDWIRWLRLRQELGWRQEATIRALVRHSGEFRSSSDALAASGIDDRSARRWLRSAALPAASAWFYASRVLLALLRLQRDPELTVSEIALQLGYSGPDTLSNQMFRYFGHGAEKGRRVFGLEARFRAFEAPAATRRS